MTPETPHPCIVADYDGSAASRAALSLAVARARPGGSVVVVTRSTCPTTGMTAGG